MPLLKWRSIVQKQIQSDFKYIKIDGNRYIVLKISTKSSSAHASVRQRSVVGSGDGEEVLGGSADVSAQEINSKSYHCQERVMKKCTLFCLDGRIRQFSRKTYVSSSPCVVSPPASAAVNSFTVQPVLANTRDSWADTNYGRAIWLKVRIVFKVLGSNTAQNL